MSDETMSVEEILNLIRDGGGRVTAAKRALIESLSATSHHVTAEELTSMIQRVVPDTGPSTVYRNLEELEELGIVVHSHLGRAAAVYHLAGPVHGHLTCSACGRTIEVPSGLFEALTRTAARDFNFRVDRHHLAISGWCSACQSD